MATDPATGGLFAKYAMTSEPAALSYWLALLMFRACGQGLLTRVPRQTVALCMDSKDYLSMADLARS